MNHAHYSILLSHDSALLGSDLHDAALGNQNPWRANSVGRMAKTKGATKKKKSPAIPKKALAGKKLKSITKESKRQLKKQSFLDSAPRDHEQPL